MSNDTQPLPGLATDAGGGPVVDPTKNVLDLVESAITRQDDLRAVEGKHVRQIIKLRAAEQMQQAKQMRYVERLRAEHAQELRKAEAARIDAIRAVDVGAVQQAAQVQATQATTLAAQVATSAETLRTQVAAAASAATIALAAALEPVQKDIADLRRAQYEAQGQKTQVVETQAKGMTTSSWIIALFAGASLLVGFLMFILAAITVAALVTHGFTK